MPSIPMILVNGANGIGTGYSTSIPPFKVADIIHNLKVMLYKDDTDNEDDNSIIDISSYENYPTEYVDMIPYYKGFKGSVEKTSDNKYQTVGVFERTNDTTVTVTELPIGIWTQNYKEHLEKLQSDETVKVNKKTGKVSKSKKTKELLSYTNNLGLDVSKSKGRKSKSKNKKSKGKKNNSLINDEDDMESINITLKFSKIKLDKFMKDKDKFMNTFKLVEAKSTKTTNMYLFDENNKLKKYKSAFHILEEYYGIRIQFYKKRYNHLLSKLKYQKNILREKIRFIKGIINNDIDILRKSDEEILDIMIEHDFMKISNNDDNDVNIDNDESTLDMYKYLIDMPIRSLTKNKLKELRQQHKARKEEYKSLLKKSPKTLWLDDLNTIEKCL
jgi:DNA topoisomerase-2